MRVWEAYVPSIHANAKKNANSLAAARRSRTWQSQFAYALSRHCDPCKQSYWSQARNSQENRPFLTASGVGSRSPTWTIAVSWEKALFAPQQMPGTQSQLGGLVGLVGGRWKSDGKIAWVGLELRTEDPEPRTQPLHHTTYIHTYIHMTYSILHYPPLILSCSLTNKYPQFSIELLQMVYRCSSTRQLGKAIKTQPNYHAKTTN